MVARLVGVVRRWRLRGRGAVSFYVGPFLFPSFFSYLDFILLYFFLICGTVIRAFFLFYLAVSPLSVFSF